jgi:hypothetical protein
MYNVFPQCFRDHLPNLIPDLLEEASKFTPSVFSDDKNVIFLNIEDMSLLQKSKRKTHPMMSSVMEKLGVEPRTFST